MSAVQGVLHGGRTGAQIGALGGPWGAAAGAVIGAIAGGAAGWWLGEKLADGISQSVEKGDEELSGQNEEECSGECEKIEGKPPPRGKPGSTVRGPDQTRTYGPDGFPLTDRDAGHPNEKGIGNGDHVHDWGRPANGGRPLNEDRSISRLPKPGDPPRPWRNSIPTS